MKGMLAPKKLTVWAQSLGCPKNRVDTEKLLGSLRCKIEFVRHMGKCRLVFINTCAFIEPAARESIRAIIAAAEKIGRLKRKPVLAVAGCLPGRYGTEELAREFPEIDLWLTPDCQKEWPAMLNAALGLSGETHDGRLLSTGPAYAWLKIAEGCNHNCSFCAIPGIRGRMVSEKPEQLLKEAEFLLSQGVKELDLVAQDVLGWGYDLKQWRPAADPPLLLLLRKLAELPGLRWLRLFYLYPGSITSRFLEGIAEIGEPLLPYLDIPFQHCAPEILQSMGRPFKVNPWEIARLVRSILPQAALRATLIVGYPGETEEQFESLCDFVRATRFHNLGVFTFFAEDGTPAASFPNQVPHELALERKDRLMRIQAEISREILANQVGKTMKVLVDAEREEEWPGLHAGRVWFQGPEVDGVTYVSGPGVQPGAMLDAEIMDGDVYDLSAIV